MATAEFSKFAGILRAALSQHHLLGFEMAQLEFQSQRKAMPKNVQTTTQLHSSHMLVNNAQNSPSQASAIREP